VVWKSEDPHSRLFVLPSFLTRDACASCARSGPLLSGSAASRVDPPAHAHAPHKRNKEARRAAPKKKRRKKGTHQKMGASPSTPTGAAPPSSQAPLTTAQAAAAATARPGGGAAAAAAAAGAKVREMERGRASGTPTRSRPPLGAQREGARQERQCVKSGTHSPSPPRTHQPTGPDRRRQAVPLRPRPRLPRRRGVGAGGGRRAPSLFRRSRE